MAHISKEYCNICKKETQHTNDKCSKRRYRERTATWNTLTIDEKLKDLRKRVEKLEKGPIRF